MESFYVERLALAGFLDSGALLHCTCSEVIIKSRGPSEVVRAKVLLIKSGLVFAVCKNCNAEIELPLCKSGPLWPKLYLDK